MNRVGMISVGGRHAGGFTLLEAIVAMVVFSLGAFALYGWLSTNTITLQRIIDRRETADVRTSALEALRLVNPMTDPSGQREMDGMRVQWVSKPVEPPKPGVTQVGLPNLFSIGLYEMQVRVSRQGRLVDEFSVRQVGFDQVRGLELD